MNWIEIIEKYALDISTAQDEEREDVFYYSAFSCKEGGYHGQWRTSVVDAIQSWAFANDVNLEAK